MAGIETKRSWSADPLLERGWFLADQTISSLALEAYVRRWNSGDPDTSVIRCTEDLRYAVTYDEKLWDGFDDAWSSAEDEGCGPEYRAALAARMEPIISSTSVVALIRITTEWASDLLDDPPPAAAGAPFRDVETCIDWILRNTWTPPYAGPMGVSILDVNGERAIAELALRAAMIVPRPQWLK